MEEKCFTVILLYFSAVYARVMHAVCARLARLLRSLTANQEVPGSIPGLVES